MINKLITYLLDKLIGKYVDNFTCNNVKTGLFRGDLKLENLPLKKGVLEDLTECPITVISGLIGQVTLRIPYTQLRTQAWAIMLEDIYIVAGPDFKRQVSPEKEQENEATVRKLILDSLEAKWRKIINHESDMTKAGDNTWLSSVASLGYRILRNIQIEVRNVHIRYEDCDTIPSSRFALGLVIEEFSTKSSDFEWNSKKELKVDVNVVQKFLNLNNIRVYLDPVCDSVCEDLSPDNIKSILEDKLRSIRDVDYVMLPISINGTMKRHLTPMPIYDEPRILLHLQMQQLELSLTQQQYQISVRLLNEFDRHDRQKHHIKTRPSLTIFESPRKWWIFAIKEHMPNTCKGDALVKRTRNIILYVKLYEMHLLERNSDNVPFTNDLEIDLDFDIVVALREIAVDRAKRRSREIMIDTVSKVAQPQKGWWAYLWGTKTKEIPAQSLSQQEGLSETNQILEKILPEDFIDGKMEQDISDILNEIDHDATNFFTKDKIFLRGQFLLSGIRLQLLRDVDKPIVGIQAENLSVGFESRPSYGSWQVKVGLKSLLMQDLSDRDMDSPFVDVVSCVNRCKVDDKDIFMLAFERNPLPMTSEPGIKNRLAVTSAPLTIIHCPRLINNVKQYLESIRSNHNIRAVAKKHIRNAKIRTRASLKEMIEKEVSVDKWQILLKISAPKLVLPNYATSQHNATNCVVLDLGRLQVSNCDESDLDSLVYGADKTRSGEDSDIDDDDPFVTPATSPVGSIEDLSLDNGRENGSLIEEYGDKKVYEEYSIVLDNIMVLAGVWTDLKVILARRSVKKRSDIMVMEPFRLQLNLRLKYLPDNNTHHPNMILETTITRLLINLSDSKVILVKGCLKSLGNHLSTNRENIVEKRRRYQKKSSQTFDPTIKIDIDQDRQLLAATFVLHALIIQLESDKIPLAELTLKQAQFRMIQYRSRTSVDIRLLSLIMADARANLGPNLDFIVASHKGAYTDTSVSIGDVEDPLIVVSYEIHNSRTPEHHISVAFSGLDIIANQETIMELVAFANHIVAEESPDRTVKDKDNMVNERLIKYVNLTVTCRSVRVLFINILVHQESENRSAVQIGTMSLDNMTVRIITSKTNLHSTITIRRISIHDLSTPDSLHREILSLTTGTNEINMSSSVTEDVIKLTIVSECSSGLYTIAGTMPHFIYLHSPQFIDSVEHCITAFQVYLTRFKDNITAVARTAILASPDHTDGIEVFTKCRIHIQMLSPILVLPRYKTSKDVIIVHLGDIDISNDDTSLSLVFTDATVISRSLPIHNSSYKVEICTDTENGFFILKKTNLHLKVIKIASSSNSNEFSGIDINATISPSLSISLSKDVYEQVLNSFDNLVYDRDDDEEFISRFVEETEEDDELDSNELAIRVHSNLSELKIELYPDTFVICDDPMLRLTLKDTSMEFLRVNKFIKDISVAIEYLSLYQTLDSSQNKLYQPLLYSTYPQYPLSFSSRPLSTSCPDVSDTDNFFAELDVISTSLPRHSNIHHNPSMFMPAMKKSNSDDKDIFNISTDSRPVTHNVENGVREKFVKIKAKLVDRKIRDFATTYNSINRFIDASFTDLTCRITTDIWVLLLDFFGLGSKFFDPNDIKQLTDVTKVLPSFNRRYDGQIEEIVNKKLTVQMNEFNLRLENEVKYPNFENLAGFSVTNLSLSMDSMDGNLNLSGSVEDFELEDLSPTGAIYRKRLFPASDQERLLEFKMFKYGLPDPSLLREEDMRLSVSINCPIVYVHTQRFLQELSLFVQNFFQYQDRLSHMRVTSAGRVVDQMAPRSARIRMKVSCQAPLLLIPVSVFSDHILVADLGRFSLHNEFKFPENDPSRCLLDEMCIDLHNMDVYSAVRVSATELPMTGDLVFPKMTIRPMVPKPLSNTCNLHLTVSRNLDSNISHSSPDWLLNGTLSSVVCNLNLDQYRVIRGVLCHNFGENTDHLNRHRFQAFQTDPTLNTNLTGVVWLGMQLEIYLNDVQVNLLSSLSSDQSSSSCTTICRMNYLQSKLSFKSFSDSSKIIELACQDITVEDLRYQSYPVNKRPSVFPTVLSRDNTDSTNKDQSSCQLKIKYTSSIMINKFDIFLNTMKVITIFDWIKASQAWIFTPPYEIISLSESNEKYFDEFATLYVQSIPNAKSVSLHPHAAREHYREIVKEDFKSTEISCEVEESRFFILEKANQSNSNALILTVAGKCSYRTREFNLGPFSFNIPKLHLASCSMSCSSSNLPSIVNPMKIQVTTTEKCADKKSEPSLDNVLLDDLNPKLSINISFSAFKVRLSFCDLQLLATILRSLPSQTTPPANVAHQVGSIRHKWSSISISESTDTSTSKQPLQRLSKFVYNVTCSHLSEHDFISICLIDDCIDADVPLFDIKLNNLKINWRLGFTHVATMNTSLSMDYYNINSFGWTPIIEPWPLKFSWKLCDNVTVQLQSNDILSIDVSSHLLQIARNTHKKWSSELASGNLAIDRIKRDRTPFVPFVIVNQLGCPIKYAKLPIDRPPAYDEAVNGDGLSRDECWYLIEDSMPQTLCFDQETTARDKIRYDRYGMHYNSSHRIELVIDGCRKCHPITVDKLGTFYRDLIVIEDNGWMHNRIRIIIDIVRQGSVQNKIILQSSLLLHNSLNIPLQIRLYNTASDNDGIIDVQSFSRVPIPLFSVYHRIQVKPISTSHAIPSSPPISNCLVNSPVDFSEDLTNWQTVTTNQKVDKEIVCPTQKGFFYSEKKGNAVYLICTVELLDSLISSSGLPGHVITISAPLSIENLLPYDLKFDTSLETNDDSTSSKVTNCGIIQASQICTVLTSSMHNTTQLAIELDNFPLCNKLTIPGHTKLSHVVLMCLFDSDNRKLELQVKVESRPSGPVQVTVFASYWIVNRTSLPLVYAQAGNLNNIAAGQSLENEKASSPMPFPFSFSNFETYQLVIRLGNKSKASNGDQLRPHWSPKLSLDKLGIATIQLKAGLPDINRPHLQYNIGLEIRLGKDRHRATTMVILTSRYLLDNRSSYLINITQYKCVNQHDPDMSIIALPKSMLSFHWPRDDLDPLLSIQLLNSSKTAVSLWSGGFRIDQTSSFHVYLRGVREYAPTQLRVTVTLQGARFRVVFTDTDGIPPPYLLQNLTRLQLFFSQIVPENNSTRHSLLAPNTSVPYALDEPTLPPNVNLSIEGGSHSIYSLNSIGPAASLHYDNFLYLVVADSGDSDQVLVLDVQPNNRRVFLNYRNQGSRSQLWYYSSNCELFHEGSIAPHDPKQKFDRSADNHYLLDVDLIAPTQSTHNQHKYQMKLARADPRREKFQRWRFTDDGCLTNNLDMKCRTVAICQNAPVFSTFVAVEKTLPLVLLPDWYRPGSGTVLVSILTNGPTRVLRICDQDDCHKFATSHHNLSTTVATKSTSSLDNSPVSKIEIMVKLKEVGVFLINHVPEELMYMACSDIEVEWCRQRRVRDDLDMRIGHIQCDNQLMDTGSPCFLYQDTSQLPKDSFDRTAFSLRYERELGHPFDVHVFNSIQVHLVPLTIIIEEKLLLKVIQMLSPPSVVTETETEDFSQLLHYSDFHEGKKIYVGNLRVLTGTMCLSVITADTLTADLKLIKKLIPYLMSFANAQIPIDPYNREHVFETSSLIFQGLAGHYQSQLRSQAIKIFGSVDFLGNPIGFISDITSGMKRFYTDQNLPGMIKHFAHGIGDSTAKICNSASRVVYGITLDPEYQERRQILLDEARISNSHTAHVKAGFRSFLNGIVGGAMSVPVQTWQGYKDYGSTGLFSGALKGMVGIVTKPVGGILDLATGSAASFREMARSSREGQPQRRCEPRCLSSSWKLLPFYSSYGNNLRHAVVLSDLAQAQILLAKFSRSSNTLENVVGLLVIKNSVDSQIKILVSDSYIHVISTIQRESIRMKCYQLSQLSTPPVSINYPSSRTPVVRRQRSVDSGTECNAVYIKFNCLYNTNQHQAASATTSGPTFKCDSVQMAKQVVKLVCEAQCDYLERQMTVTTAAATTTSTVIVGT